jgi:hypothetical protein
MRVFAGVADMIVSFSCLDWHYISGIHSPESTGAARRGDQIAQRRQTR